MNESTATRHQRLRRRTKVTSVAVGAVWLAVLALTPLGSRLADWAQPLAWPVPAFVLLVVIVWEVVAVFAAVCVSARERRRGRRGSEPPDPLLSVLLRDALVGTGVGVGGGLGLAAVIAEAGDAWWWVAGVLASLTFVVVAAAVGLVTRTRAGSRPLGRASLRQRLDGLSASVCGAAIPVREWDGGEAVGSAMVTGVGPGATVLLSQDLAREWPEDEVEVVVAHELAHLVRRDLWRKAAFDGVVMTAAAWTAEQVARPQSLASLPAAAVVMLLMWWLLRPIRLVQSRAHERAADRLALQWTQAPDAFRRVIRRMESRHLVEERPSRLTRWYFHKHPTVQERLTLVQR